MDYDIDIDLSHEPLELIDIPSVVRNCESEWFNQSLCRVNDAVVRLGVVHGEFHWHAHEQEDEFFYVVEGRLVIDLETNSQILEKGQGFLVPRGLKHRTSARERTVLLMIEGHTVAPCGDG